MSEQIHPSTKLPKRVRRKLNRLGRRYGLARRNQNKIDADFWDQMLAWCRPPRRRQDPTVHLLPGWQFTPPRDPLPRLLSEDLMTKLQQWQLTPPLDPIPHAAWVSAQHMILHLPAAMKHATTPTHVLREVTYTPGRTWRRLILDPAPQPVKTHMAPVPGGGIQFDWARVGLEIEIEIAPDGLIMWLVTHPSGEFSGASTDALTVAAALETLLRRE